MAPTLTSSWRAFWHTMTSNDRHASHDTPYRTGQHVPLPQSRRSTLSPTATSALESRTDLDLEAGSGFVSHIPSGSGSPLYSPSRRTSAPHRGSGAGGKLDGVSVGEIQMQSFNDGLPPPPPVNHSWKRIDRWLEDNYEELFENLGEPATINDVNELEHELDCTLPTEVRESLQIHDGQERGGLPTGVVFGCMLLDCEEIMQEWQNWRTVNEAYFNNDPRTYEIPQAPTKAFAASSSSSQIPVAQLQQSGNPQWRSDLLDKQDSQPPGAVQKVYAHPAWIPLARDWGGNNIAVDLAPGPAGKWGQVILIGRDYDCKYVVSRSWSAFLATLADDMSTDKWFIDEDTKELKFRQFKQPGVEPAYIDILRWRSDQKHGRRIPRKRSLNINPNAAGPNGSPYGSPTSEDRGRSPQRFPSNGKAPATSSPRAHVGSPLARVTEEQSPIQPAQPQPLRVATNIDNAAKSTEKLLSGIETPPSANPTSDPLNAAHVAKENSDSQRGSQPVVKSRLGSSVPLMSADDSPSVSATVPSEKISTAAISDLDGEMKEVKI